MKKVFFLTLLCFALLSIKAQNSSPFKSVDSTITNPNPKIRYWNHSEIWFNYKAVGLNIINGISINKTNFIGIGIGTSMNGISRFQTRYLTLGIRYQHDFMIHSKVSPFVYTNAGIEYGFGPRFEFRELNLANSIGTGVKFHTKKDVTFGLAFELKNTFTLVRTNQENTGSAPMRPVLKFFVNFGSGNKTKKQVENLKEFYK